LAFDATRYWSFFVLDTFLKFKNAFLAIFLFKLDVLHKVVKDCFSLKAFLLSFALFWVF
jgi:hypothetical protein